MSREPEKKKKTKTVAVIESDLVDVINIQCAHGNWNYDPYMHGMANSC